jgi:hypothetical protein
MTYDAARGQVVMFGGASGTFDPNKYHGTWVWDGTNWHATFTANEPSPRYFGALAYDSAHGQVVLFGGTTGPGTFYGGPSLWDGSTWTAASPVGSVPTLRYGHSMAWDDALGGVVLFGGYNGSTLGDTWVWDGSNWSQKRPASSPPGRLYSAVAYDAAHRQVVLFGGWRYGARLNDTWVWGDQHVPRRVLGRSR